MSFETKESESKFNGFSSGLAFSFDALRFLSSIQPGLFDISELYSPFGSTMLLLISAVEFASSWI